jgi:hypothetical protein
MLLVMLSNCRGKEFKPAAAAAAAAPQGLLQAQQLLLCRPHHAVSSTCVLGCDCSCCNTSLHTEEAAAARPQWVQLKVLMVV